MTTIDQKNNFCTVINVFWALPGKQHELFESLKEATEKVMSKLPGYVSANIHVGEDKKTVANYAQWASLVDFHNMMKNEEAQKHMKIVSELCSEFRPAIYNTIWSHSVDQTHVIHSMTEFK
jgi:antibiotic biosynthesis monooxygenase (ABM) superfamily enzyme